MLANFLQKKWMVAVVLIGLYCLLLASAEFFLVNVSIKSLLFSLDARYWNLATFAALWILAIGLLSESLGIFEENYQIAVRYSLGLLGLLCLFVSFTSSGSVSIRPNTLLLYGGSLLALGCAVRSIFLFNAYKNDSLEDGAIEEAQWFWMMTMCLIALISLVYFMQVCTIVTDDRNPESIIRETLWVFCYRELQQTIRTGGGSIFVWLFAFIMFFVSLGFVWLCYRWAQCMTAMKETE